MNDYGAMLRNEVIAAKLRNLYRALAEEIVSRDSAAEIEGVGVVVETRSRSLGVSCHKAANGSVGAVLDRYQMAVIWTPDGEVVYSGSAPSRESFWLYSVIAGALLRAS